MPFQMIADDGSPLDAHLDVEGPDLVFHSRGGVRGRPGARNLDYGPGLRLLLRRVRAAGARLDGAWLDSDDVRGLPIEARRLMEGSELAASPDEQFSILSGRMQAFGRPADAPYGGSHVKRIRLRVTGAGVDKALAVVVGAAWAEPVSKVRRLPAAALQQVTAEHLWEAVQRLRRDPDGHAFGEAREFDVVLEDGRRLAPKAVFGVAASAALEMDVGPSHFTGGVDSPCHRALKDAGFSIVARGGQVADPEAPVSEEDRVWVEGRPTLVLHLRRERAAGLAKAKKQRFLCEHGALRCERCGLDPVEAFGAAVGEACIEVHHSRTGVGDMAEDHHTRLDDLQCLCANCHRIVHALIRLRGA
ncbi:hypothetical protein [Phenylobacterium sp.]|uniref:HNH endonuclease n=1 Tax=Phenylobacterium sp. TaxID=1871053 RepID=UPI0035AFE1B9